MICVTIIDRDAEEANLVEQSLRMLTASRTNELIRVSRYTSAGSYMSLSDRKEPVNMAVIDVTSAGGIEAARQIRAAHRTAQILLMSNRTLSPEYYVQPSIGACYLIVRPESAGAYRNRIREMFEGYLAAAPEEEIWFRSNHSQIRLPLEEILFFESVKKGVLAQTASGTWQFRNTLSGLEKVLGEERFFRCHRFYLVNCRHIRAVRLQKGMIQLSDGTVLPLGKVYHHQIRERIQQEMALFEAAAG